MRMCFGRLFLLVGLTLFPTSRLLCWETDTHYGLTKWLAVKAGFSLQDAEAIALAVQAPDEGQLYPAPFAVAKYTCFGRDSQASRFLQEHHFPSYGTVPGEPKDRAVVPGIRDNAADLWVRKEVATSFADVPRGEALRNFGTSLHPLEDSWSHQGIPDIPPWPCTDQLSWGHPKQRGGWRSHNADITHLHIDDSLATAARIYELMVEYLDSHPSFRVYSSFPWSQVELRVRDFAAGATKVAKRKWFDSDPDVPLSSYTYRGFLDHINLPEGSHTSVSIRSPIPRGRIVNAAQKAFPSPNCVQEFVEAFLRQWIIEQKIEGYLQSIDIPSVAARLASGEQTSQLEPQLWVMTAFRMWLLPDHGLVNQLGHGIGAGGQEEGLKRLSEILQDREAFPLMRYGGLGEAILAPGTAAPFLLVAVPTEKDQQRSAQNQRYAALFQFRHAPHDALALTVENRNGKWTVIGLDWFI